MNNKPTEPRFWMVWNPNGHSPTAKHWSRAAADKEAARLSTQNPGQRFYVLKAVGGSQAGVPEPSPIKLRRAAEIPF